MKTKLFFMLLAVFLSVQLKAQRKIKQMDSDKQQQEDEAKSADRKPWKDNVQFGGAVSATFGSNYTNFFLQPIAAYKVTDRYTVGAGVTYNYWSQSFISTTNNLKYEYSDNAFGFNLFNRYRIAGGVFAHVEYMPMNFTSFNLLEERKRIWGQSLYLGGGVQQSAIYAVFLYDVLWQEYKPSDPTSFARSYRTTPFDIRIGILF